MREPPDPAAEAIRAAIRRGLAPETESLERLGDRELAAVFRRLLVESADVARPVLVRLIARDPGRAGDVAAEALGKWGGAVAGSLLRGIDAARLAPSRRKALRRALHFFEAAHGIEGTREPRAPPETAPVAERSAFVNAPSFLGGRVWLFRVREAGGRSGRLAVVAVSERRGVRDFAWQDGSDAAFDRYRRRLGEQEVVLAEVPWDYLRFRLRQLERGRTEARAEAPANYEGLRRWLDLDGIEATEMGHPARPEVGILETDRPPSPAEVRGLLELGETRQWMLPPDAFEGGREAIAEASRSRLVLDGRDPEERLRQTLGRQIEQYLDDTEREAWHLRLLDLALVLGQSGRERYGRTAALIATDLTGGVRSPVADAFLWALAMRTLGVRGGAAPPEPGEAEPEAEEPGGGLIAF